MVEEREREREREERHYLEAIMENNVTINNCLPLLISK